MFHGLDAHQFEPMYGDSVSSFEISCRYLDCAFD